MTHKRAHDLKRLDLLLKLAHTDLLKLDDEGWEALFDTLFIAIFGTPRPRGRSDDFHFVASRSGVGLAQASIKAALESLRTTQPARLTVGEHTVFLVPGEETRYRCKDIQTMIILTLEELWRGVTAQDFYICNDRTCGRLFVPRRRPHKGVRTFCCPGHENRVIKRESRQQKRDDSKKQERERSRRRYVRQVTKGRPNLKVAHRSRERELVP